MLDLATYAVRQRVPWLTHAYFCVGCETTYKVKGALGNRDYYCPESACQTELLPF